MAYLEDNLLTTTGGISHHGEFPMVDEEITCVENTVPYLWFQLINSLAQRYQRLWSLPEEARSGLLPREVSSCLFCVKRLDGRTTIPTTCLSASFFLRRIAECLRSPVWSRAKILLMCLMRYVVASWTFPLRKALFQTPILLSMLTSSSGLTSMFTKVSILHSRL